MRVQHLVTAVVGLLFALPATQAQADKSAALVCTPDDEELQKRLDACKPQPPPKKKRRHKKKATPPPIPQKGDKGDSGTTGPQGPEGPEGSAGPQGPSGPQGPAGPRGPSGPQGVAEGPVYPLNVALGLMGGLYAPTKSYAWVWGPALQVQAALNPRTELTVALGLGMGADSADWSPGRENGRMFRLGLTRYTNDWFGLGLNVSALSIDSTLPDKESGEYLGLTPGVVFRKRWNSVTLRASAGVFVGGSAYGAQRTDRNLEFGGEFDTVLSWNW